MRISIFILLAILGVIICADTLYDQIPLGNDFMQDYAAAIALGRGEPIYGLGIGEITYSILGNFRMKNYHPPFIAFLILPLSFFSYFLASWIWLFLSCGFYLLSLFLLYSYVNKKHELGLWVNYWHFSPLVILWYPWVAQAGLGQLSAILLLLISCTLIVEQKGILLGLAASIKIFPLYLFLPLLLTRRMRDLFAAILTITATSVMAACILGGEVWSQFWLQKVVINVRSFLSYPLNHSLSGVLSAIFETSKFTQALYTFESHRILSLSLGIVLTFTIALRSFVCRLSFDQMLGVFIPAMLLVTPISWAHTGMLLLVSIATHFSRFNRIQLFLLVLLTAIPDPSVHRFLIGMFLPDRVPAAVSVLFRLHFWAYVLVLYVVWPRKLANATSS